MQASVHYEALLALGRRLDVHSAQSGSVPSLGNGLVRPLLQNSATRRRRDLLRRCL